MTHYFSLHEVRRWGCQKRLLELKGTIKWEGALQSGGRRAIDGACRYNSLETVWIDFFTDRNEPHVGKLQELPENEADLSLCGIIMMELLQGIRSDTDFFKTKEYLDDLIFLPMRHGFFIRAAKIYRSLRKRGITIRKPIDCMIASVAIEYDILLLHNDRDFKYIARYSRCDTFA